MKLLVFSLVALLLDSASVVAQTSPSPSTTPTFPEISLTRKIDELNAKIDILSQEILKLEQQISHARPGIMIGQPEGASATPAASATPMPRSPGGTAHTVERGETLTSIGKLYGVGPSELQRYNHIEDPLKLRAGQTIMIPASPTPAASVSPGQ